MSDKSGIEWTDATWNPTRGCTKVSPGCDHCYAETFAERWRGVPGHAYEEGFDPRVVQSQLGLPLRWKRPRRIFVNSMSDLFHEAMPDDYIAQVFAVMARASQHTFQVLTKRHARMRSLLNSPTFRSAVFALLRAQAAWESTDAVKCVVTEVWPLPNVWLGVSVESQRWADIRVPALLGTPAAVRFLSCEPLLGSVTFRWRSWLGFEPGWRKRGEMQGHLDAPRGIGWVIVGGESGPGARPMHPGWVRFIRDDCADASVPFFFKQWGAWSRPEPHPGIGDAVVMVDGTTYPWHPDVHGWTRLGPRDFMAAGPAPYGAVILRHASKHANGRLLDGRTHDAFPAVAS